MFGKQLIATGVVFGMDQYPEGLPSLQQLGNPAGELDLPGWSGNANDAYIYNLLNSMERAPVAPYIEITEQPKPKENRFRYPCEGRTAGALLGAKSTAKKKTSPEVKICNLAGRAMIVGSLVFKDEDKPHPYKLVGRNCENGIVTRIVEPNNPKVRFESVGIQCVKRAELEQALQMRKSLNVDPFNNIDAVLQEDLQDIECKVVRICFQAFLEDPNNPETFNVPLSPVLSNKIFNKKDTSLKIIKMNQNCGLVTGDEELFIFCEKVDKDDIQVEFYEESPPGVTVWSGHGVFGSEDVHHQVAIVLRTPPYKTTEIKSDIMVKISLMRPSDEDRSEPMNFIYIPNEDMNDAEGFTTKRRKRKFEEENYLKLKDEPGCSGVRERKPSTSEHVRKRLKEKIGRRMAIKKEAPATPQPQQENPMSFPSVTNPNRSITVQTDTSISHVTVSGGVPPPADFSLNLPPDLLTGSGYVNQGLTGEEPETIDLDQNIPITDIFGNSADFRSQEWNKLFSDMTQLGEGLPQLDDPLLSQANVMQAGNSGQSLPGIGEFLSPNRAPYQAGEPGPAPMEVSYPGAYEDISD